MAFPHTINGTWPTGVTIVDLPDPFGVPDFSGADVSIPRRRGEVFGGRTAKGRDYTMVLRLSADTEGAWYDLAQTLVDLVANLDVNGRHQPVTLGRTRPTTGGTVVEEAEARYDRGLQGIGPNFSKGPNNWRGTAAVVFRLLDGRFTEVTP